MVWGVLRPTEETKSSALLFNQDRDSKSHGRKTAVHWIVGYGYDADNHLFIFWICKKMDKAVYTRPGQVIMPAGLY